MTIEEQLQAIHGDRICHICKKLCREEGLGHCSYPHRRIPVEPIDPENPKGFWSWKKPEETE